MVNNNNVRYTVVDSKQEIVEFLRDEEIRVLRIESESTISETDLLEYLGEFRCSPQLLDVLYNQVEVDEIFHEVGPMNYNDIVEVIIRVVMDGLVYYKQSPGYITIYELGELTGDIGTVPAMDEDILYVPYLYDLHGAYNDFKAFERVLSDVNWRRDNRYDGYEDLFTAVIDDELYGYIKRYCGRYYGL